ncbi:MAG: SoxR reducing system RseC family protein [Prevotellaceae bacterium]|jgi:sigma-E factor negative regulatory protein RseC|nr:SoxR reducing system RseC family protein [Prevotellaceae bacterium]
MLQDKRGSCSKRKGIVSKITDESIAVNIINMSACSACHANGMCQAFERQEKTVYVANTGQQVHDGESVNVVMQTGMGLKAAFFAYFLPVFIVVAVLLILTELGIKEYLTGVISVCFLAVYYCILRLFREKLKNQIHFYIEKI